MTDQPNKEHSQNTLDAFEGDLFGTLFAFHKKTMALLRESSLDNNKMKTVADRIKTLLDAATAEVKQTQQLNIKERLAAAYEEVKRLVDELNR